MKKVEKSAIVFGGLKAGQQILHDLDGIVLDNTTADMARYGMEQISRLGAVGVAAYAIDKAASYLEELALPKYLRGAMPFIATTVGATAAIHYLGNYMNIEQGIDIVETAKHLLNNYQESLTKLVTFDPSVNGVYLGGALVTIKSGARLLRNICESVAHAAEKKKAKTEYQRQQEINGTGGGSKQK